MQNRTIRWRAISFLILAGLIGCTGGGGSDGKKGKELTDEEKEVKAEFEKLQKALDERDMEKIWAHLDDKSQKDAEVAAKHIRESYAKAANDNARDELKKKYTYVEQEKKETKGQMDKLDLAALTGKTVLRTKTFHDTHHEKEDGKFDKVVIKGNDATVHYVEEEGGKRTLGMVKQEGKWKAFLQVPR